MSYYMIFGFGGIGSAVCKQLIEEGHRVSVATRRDVNLLQIEKFDYDDLDDTLQTTIPDYIINTIGILHDDKHMPEKNVKQIDEQWLLQNMNINVVPTIRIVQSLNKVMQRNTAMKMLTISARVSSISGNHLGGWYSYRMSKAALNMLIKTLSIEWQRQYPEACIFGYHPGTVDTPLSKPFQTHVSPEKLFTPKQAATYLLTVFEQRTKQDSGLLFDWQGKKIAF